MDKSVCLFGLLMAIQACGFGSGEVLLGRFDVEKVFSHWEQNGGTPCADTATSRWKTGDTVDQVWIISEEDFRYTLTQEDSKGNSLITGVSVDGYYFKLSGPAMGGNMSIERWLEYGDDKFVGDEKNTWSISGESCSENWTLIGNLN